MNKNIYLFVIDGLGVANNNGISTLFELVNITGLDLLVDLPFLSANGLIESTQKFSNCMLQKSIEPGSFIGHQEMFGKVYDTAFSVPNNKLPLDIINSFKERTGIELIGNEQGRGKYLLKKYYETHLQEDSLILYRGYDSTIIIAGDSNKFSTQIFKQHLHSFRDLLDSNTSLKIKKVLGRRLDKLNTVEQFEIFPSNNTDCFKGVFKTKFNYHFNRKIGEIFRFMKGTEISTKSDEDIYKYFQTLNQDKSKGFYFFNFEDFDKFAHKGDVFTCMEKLIAFDKFIKSFYSRCSSNDWIIITADHGVNFLNSDLSNSHKIEYVPVIVLNKKETFNLSGCYCGHELISKIVNEIS